VAESSSLLSEYYMNHLKEEFIEILKYLLPFIYVLICPGALAVLVVQFALNLCVLIAPRLIVCE